MAREQFNTRLAAPDAKAVHQYKDDLDVDKSEAIRRLIVAGLEAEGYPKARTDGGTVMRPILTQFAATAALVGIVAGSIWLLSIVAGWPSSSSTTWQLATVAPLLGFLAAVALLRSNAPELVDGFLYRPRATLRGFGI